MKVLSQQAEPDYNFMSYLLWNVAFDVQVASFEERTSALLKYAAVPFQFSLKSSSCVLLRTIAASYMFLRVVYTLGMCGSAIAVTYAST